MAINRTLPQLDTFIKAARLPASLLLSILLTGCMSMASERLAGNISHAMLNQPDPEIVRSGAPAYLLLLDSMIAENPNNRALLISAARLYGAYANGLVQDQARQQILSGQAMSYASRAFCPTNQNVCNARNKPYGKFVNAVDKMDASDLAAMFTYASTWAGLIEANQHDWNAIAELPKVELLLQHVIDKAPEFDRGRAQLYLGMLRTLRPPSMGGKPELGKKHFELAIAYSEEKDLMAKVAYAKHYARLVYNQELHDRLLTEVLEASPEYHDLTLSNVLAQQQARELLNDEYF